MGKSKIEYKEQVRIVRDYLSGKTSYGESVQAARNSDSTFRQMLARYDKGGAGALLPQERNNIYPTEIKLAAVRAYLSGEGSMEKICEKYGLRSDRQLRNWIKVYNAHGDFDSVKHSGGGSYMKQGRNTTKEEHLEIVRDCLSSGKNYGEMALKYKVSYQQVRAWTLRFEEVGENGLEDRRGQRKKDQIPRTELEAAQIEIEKLKHQLYLAEMERDLLKKLDEIERRDVSHR